MKRINIALKILAVASVVFFSVYSYIKVPVLTNGFASYYTTSRMLYEGEDLSRGYEPDFFNRKINEYGFKNLYDLFNIIPTVALVYYPVAVLTPENAKLVWSIFSIILLLLSAYILFKTFNLKLNNGSHIFFLIIIFLYHPVYENIALGQIYIFLLFLFSLCLYGFSRDIKILKILPVTLGVMFKGYGVLYFLWLPAVKKYKIFFASLFLLIILFLVSLTIIHISVWKTFITMILSNMGRNYEDSNVAYQTVNGFLRHLLIFNKDYNPFPLADINPNIVFASVVIIDLFIIIMLIRKSRQFQDVNDFNLLSLSAILASSVVTAPVAEEYSFTLFIPVIIALGCLLFKVGANNPVRLITGPRILYVFAVLEIMLPFHYKHMQNYAFPSYLLAYPKLYGGLILLGIYIWMPVPKTVKQIT